MRYRWARTPPVYAHHSTRAVNAMAGRALPDHGLLNQRYGVRFELQDMDQIRPEPSGLMGAVHVLIAH